MAGGARLLRTDPPLCDWVTFICIIKLLLLCIVSSPRNFRLDEPVATPGVVRVPLWEQRMFDNIFESLLHAPCLLLWFVRQQPTVAGEHD